MRTFLSLAIPDRQSDALESLARKLPPGRSVDAELMHVTALFLGEVPDTSLDDLHDALDGARFELPPLKIGGFGHFGHAAPRVAWIGVSPTEPLVELNKRLSRLALSVGILLEKQRFIPHVSLCRYRRDELAAGELAAAFDRLGSRSFDPFQPVSLDLVASHLRAKGPRYELLTSYPVHPA